MIRKTIDYISHGFQSLLLWLDEHAVGILVTIALHLLLVSIALILKISAFAENLTDIPIEFVQMLPEEQEEPANPQESVQEFVEKMNEEYSVRNLPVNTAEQKAVENIEKMVRDIKTEMNIIDPPDLAETSKELEKAKDESVYDEKYPENSAGERTIYRGPTTVSYELAGRRHTWMPVPVYKCSGKGKIVMNIVVNTRGYVLQAEVNKQLSDLSDPCLVDAAKRDAERSRFNDSPAAPAKQHGTITYLFVAQ
ncbi:MAG: hypothetical protein LBF89_07865 [Bacteroidales bacterium]|jgi:hypothetical protein|nr:hypothetical protein [Bacteroidales bacterium]